ncbi:MAG: hypothetical protein AAGJ35_02420 [Myxococcota bacterium]
MEILYSAEMKEEEKSGKESPPVVDDGMDDFLGDFTTANTTMPKESKQLA